MLKNFSKKYKRNFSKLKEAERKIVNTSNGNIQIKYEGPSGPFEEAHFIPTLKNNLISLGDSVNLGIEIVIKPTEMMYKNHGKKNIFAVKMRNNV